ncbi:MAG: hypothetical protein ABII93_03815 [Chrysiogenia bacterium]
MAPNEVTFAIFDRLLAALGLIRDRHKYRNERIDQALYALYAALNETKAYIKDLDSGKKRDRKRELALAKLWHDSSIPLRDIDGDLAERCFLKGSYWLEPGTWTDVMIKRKRIKLDQVLKSTRNLLMKV